MLSDAEKRDSYDRYGRVIDSGWHSGFEGFNFGGLGNIFDAFFGGATSTSRRRAPQKGADLRVRVTLSFEGAAFGAEKEFEIERVENCSLCYGLGCKPGTNPQRCPECNGNGQVRRSSQSLFGNFVQIVTCSRCNGEGTIIAEPCPQCKGKGRSRVKRNIKVTIPPGVDGDHPMRLRGEGEAGIYGGQPGDVYIIFSVKPHAFFIRDGYDIFYELPINFGQAALGDNVEIPTLDGKTILKIPPGTQNRKIFHLKGKGVPRLDGKGRGDQLVGVRVVTPQSLDSSQRKLFEELAKTLPQENIPEKKDKGEMGGNRFTFRED